MVNACHSAQTVSDGIHIAHAFSFANSTARLAASVTAADVGKIAQQTDDDTFWILVDDSPVTWSQIDSGAAAGATQFLQISALKSTAGTINAGEAVYLVGYSTDHTVELARADSESTMLSTGIATSTITDAVSGTVVLFGEVDGLDTSMWADGDMLWVSPTAAGGLVSTRPDITNIIQPLVQVIRSHATLGEVMVFGSNVRQPPPHIYPASATDPSTGPTASNGYLYYNTALDLWMTYDATRAKWLSVEKVSFIAARKGTTASGSYLEIPGELTMSATRGYTALRDGTIVGLSYTRSDTDASTFEVVKSGTAAAELATSALKGKSTTLDGDFSADDVLAVRIKSGGNDVEDAAVLVELRWRV